jgi:hypothetical protein
MNSDGRGCNHLLMAVLEDYGKDRTRLVITLQPVCATEQNIADCEEATEAFEIWRPRFGIFN